MAASQLRKPTIKNVARRAGASIAAVSYAINGNRFVSEQLSERNPQGDRGPRLHAQQDRAELAAQPHPDHRPDHGRHHEPFRRLFTKGLESAAAEQQYTLIISDLHGSPANESRSVNLLLDQRVDGIIYCGFGAEEVAIAGDSCRRPARGHGRQAAPEQGASVGRYRQPGRRAGRLGTP